MKPNEDTKIVESPYFVTSLIVLEGKELKKDFYNLDSFIILICLEGEGDIIFHNRKRETVVTGETVLIPADLKEFSLGSRARCKLLKVHVPDAPNTEDGKFPKPHI